MLRTQVIGTERDDVVLRKLASPIDYEAFFNLVLENRSHLMRYCEGVVRNVPVNRLGNYVDLDERYGIYKGRLVMGSVVLAEGENPDIPEIGYFLGEKFTGNGYATIAVRALSRYALSTYSSVETRIAESNEKSIKVAERAGFRRLGKIAGTGMIRFGINEAIAAEVDLKAS